MRFQGRRSAAVVAVSLASVVGGGCAESTLAGGGAAGQVPLKVTVAAKPAAAVRAAGPHRYGPIAVRHSARAFLAYAGHAHGDEHATPSRLKALDPCALVSAREARSFLAAPVRQRTLAPMGPTCIYRTARLMVTVAVETTAYDQLRSEIHGLQPFAGVGRPTYCGGAGGSSALFVRLGPTTVLHLTGPCQITGNFAARALGRLPAIKSAPPRPRKR
jgi:hypothetical protein